MKLVSILIPVRNAERWVAQAIESALAQTWPFKEVIVVDDGSTDRSLEIIKGFGSAIHCEAGEHRGGNVARNRLLELSRGEWLQYLDADDYLLPDKVARQMSFIEDHPETDIAYGPVWMEYVDGSDVHRQLLPIPKPHDPWTLLARWYLPQTGAPLWRKQAVLDVGGWKDNQPCCQEHELYLRLLMREKQFSYCDTHGAVYRQWSESTVCKRDKPEVNRRRLEIEAQAEAFLQSRRELTPSRLQAINQTRFEIARTTWHREPALSMEIVKAIHLSQPHFVPAGDAAPWKYRVIYRIAGFRAAEGLAQTVRPHF